VRTISGAPFGLAICRDLIFTDFGRRYGRLGVSAMLVPAWDFYRDAWMASGVAALRGVESGYSVVRAGRESYLNVSDRYGHTIARQRSDYLPGSSVLADLSLGPATPTLYARFGNAFGWLSVAASAITIILAGRAGNQPKPATANA
jgi:apolipoprotein N-acyltransferase